MNPAERKALLLSILRIERFGTREALLTEQAYTYPKKPKPVVHGSTDALRNRRQ